MQMLSKTSTIKGQFHEYLAFDHSLSLTRELSPLVALTENARSKNFCYYPFYDLSKFTTLRSSDARENTLYIQKEFFFTSFSFLRPPRLPR
jgi:hypothetical protein